MTDITINQNFDDLLPEEKIEIDKLRKRAEKFGAPFNLEEIIASFLKKRKVEEEPTNTVEDQQEVKKKFEDRAKRFGVIMTKPQNDRHFESKFNNEISEENPLRNEALHIYGVDFLTTEDIKSFFQIYNPQKVEWINDSSCNVIFSSHEDAANAFKHLTLSEDNDQIWRRSLPIPKENLDYTLEIRFATQNDKKDQATSGKNSKYYQYRLEKFHEERTNRSRDERHRSSDKKRVRQSKNDDNHGVLNKKISKNKDLGEKRGRQQRKTNKEVREETSDTQSKNEHDNQNGDKAQETVISTDQTTEQPVSNDLIQENNIATVTDDQELEL